MNIHATAQAVKSERLKGEVLGVQKILKISNEGVAGVKFSVEGGPCSLGGSQGF